MRLEEWLSQRGGIARREDALRAGFGRGSIATAGVRAIGRRWIASQDAPAELVAAAANRAVLACVSAAAHRGLSMLHAPSELHLWAPPGAHPPPLPPVHPPPLPRAHSSPSLPPHRPPHQPLHQSLHQPLHRPPRRHRSRPMLPPIGGTLLESVPDMLGHVVACLPHVEALIIWESAIRRGLVGPAELRRYDWPHPAAARLCREAGGQSDSLLETMAADLLRHAGVPFRQQARLLGHRVDLLVGERLVVQLDGFEFHDGAQRRQDLEQDARLQLAGFRVLRFAYADLVRRPEHVLEMVRRTMPLAS